MPGLTDIAEWFAKFLLAPGIGGLVGGAAARYWVDRRLLREAADLRERARTGELLAEEKLRAAGEAYFALKRIETLVKHRDLPMLSATLIEDEEWLWRNRFFLPDRVFCLWITLRNAARCLVGDPFTQKAGKLLDLMEDLANEAMVEIYGEWNREELVVDSRLAEVLDDAEDVESNR